jgi:hypothetical protein
MDGGSKGCLLSFSGKILLDALGIQIGRPAAPGRSPTIVHQTLNRAAAIQSAELFVGVGIVPTV